MYYLKRPLTIPRVGQVFGATVARAFYLQLLLILFSDTEAELAKIGESSFTFVSPPAGRGRGRGGCAARGGNRFFSKDLFSKDVVVEGYVAKYPWAPQQSDGLRDQATLVPKAVSQCPLAILTADRGEPTARSVRRRSAYEMCFLQTDEK